MNLKIQAQEINPALTMLNRIAGARATLPVLSSVLIDAQTSPHTVTLTATDLEQRLSIEIPAEIKTPGILAVSSHMLTQSLGAETGQIEFSLDPKKKEGETRLLIKTDAATTRLALFTADDFPEPPDLEKFQTLELTAPALENAVRAVQYAPTTDPTRPVLNSITILQTAEETAIVGTDGRRLAKAVIDPAEITHPLTENTQIIIPTPAAATLLRLLDGHPKATLHIHGKPTHRTALSICAGAVQYTTRLLEGTYPNVERVIPPEGSLTNTLTLDSNDLKTALKRCLPFARDSIEGATVHIECQGATAQIKAVGLDVGSIVQTLPCKTAGTFQPLHICATFLLQAITADAKDEITLRHQDPLSPQCFTGLHANHIIMPVRTV